MLIIFVMTIYVPAGIILLIADLLLIPGLWLSFRMVRKYGKEKNDICAENVSSIVEYVSGIQTFRAYGVGGLKNKPLSTPCGSSAGSALCMKRKSFLSALDLAFSAGCPARLLSGQLMRPGLPEHWIQYLIF